MKRMALFIIVSIFLFAVPEVKASEGYIIKRGDTLWEISREKLQDPFLWPKIWEANPQIKNPDLIYPGQTITIPQEERLSPLSLPVEEPAQPVEELPPSKPQPVVKEEKPRRYLLNKYLYASSGWLSDDFPSIGKIIASPSERTIFGNYDMVYLDINGETAKGDKYLIIRDIKKVTHPKTGRYLGHQIRVTGILEIREMRDHTPVATITNAFEEVRVGDGLLKYEDVEPPFVPDIIRRPDIEGYIVESRMNNRAISAGDIIYLDKGSDDGLEVGDIFDTFSLEPVKIPIGRIQVISLRPHTSTAIVLKSSKELSIGDMWGKTESVI
ncbi:MAG: LysM domain-containing protein [Thermodesulfovibrionia bacterium]